MSKLQSEPLANSEPLPFDGSDDYMLMDLDYDTSTPPFVMTMGQTRNQPAKYVVPMASMTSEKEEEESSDEDEELPGPVESENPAYGSLDVIAVKQFQQSKMEPLSQFYVGSLTVVGLYILYRYLRK